MQKLFINGATIEVDMMFKSQKPNSPTIILRSGRLMYLDGNEVTNQEHLSVVPAEIAAEAEANRKRRIEEEERRRIEQESVPAPSLTDPQHRLVALEAEVDQIKAGLNEINEILLIRGTQPISVNRYTCRHCEHDPFDNPLSRMHHERKEHGIVTGGKKKRAKSSRAGSP